jgi:dihydrofolate reductase
LLRHSGGRYNDDPAPVCSMAHSIIGYAIVSEDGMLANEAGVIPPELIIEADQKFFMRGLDGAAAVVHGRNSFEQPRDPARKRLIATHSVAALAPDPDNPNALFWNPAGAPFEQAIGALGASEGAIAIIGGTDIFGLFLPRYDVFHLTRAAGTHLPGGRPVFPLVPARTPDALLAEAGLKPGPARVLDASRAVSLVTWTR